MTGERRATNRRVGTGRLGMAVAAGLVLASLAPSLGSASAAGPGHAVPAARVIKYRACPQGPASAADSAPGRLPSKAAQIRVLDGVLRRAAATPYYPSQHGQVNGLDVDDYDLGALWRRGIDGAGTTVAVIEGWNDPSIGRWMGAWDKCLGLPNPVISTIYPAGRLPKTCPAGMVKLGSYGSCEAWEEKELLLDVEAVHLVAPYARIVISATPADTQITDDAASQVAPPEMMKAVEYIARNHVADVISISDGTGESTYSHGKPEILAQDAGELAAAAAGIPLLVATGDCGVVQNLPTANAQCEDVTHFPDIATWDDSPWVTAVGGIIPDLKPLDRHQNPDQLWYGSNAGFSKVFRRPNYQNSVARITRSNWRSVPDLVMDGRSGTSESAPLLAGVLALATQLNGRVIGPINPALYTILGPAGSRDGIINVTQGNDSFTLPDGKVITGFSAAKGFNVASGWGTINAARFVPALVAATRAMGQEKAARLAAARLLRALADQIVLSSHRVSAGGSITLAAPGFLPEHPVRMYIDGHFIATLKANGDGVVHFVIRTLALHLTAGQHVITLKSMLLTQRRDFAVV